jgi:Secretion system C-terminal sorting domain
LLKKIYKQRIYFYRLICLSIALFCHCIYPERLTAQLTTSNTSSPAQIVNNVLLGGGITASNVTFTGYNNAIGTFSVSGTNNLGMSSGVVMTTGTILDNDTIFGSGFGPQGPNNSPGSSPFIGSGVDNGQPGDAYLTTLAGTNTYNAAILEFDFVPQSDSIQLKYVFGTDEYMEWITGGFADVFAFVVTGVTVNHPATNVGLLPGTNMPVTALNVNLNNNTQYYVDNGDGTGTGTAPDGPTVQYDGFTVVLTAKDTVTCGQTYHIKLMVADAIDGAVDAGVFLKAGSFTSLPVICLSCDSIVSGIVSNQQVSFNSSAIFSITSGFPNATFQWQTDIGFGFQNLTNAGQYSGVNNDSLVVSSATMSNNNQLFRCIVSSGGCIDTTNVAQLNVTNNVGLEENSSLLFCTVLPNPTFDKITIRFINNNKQENELEVYNQIGELIFKQKLLENECFSNIDMINYPSGIYTVRLYNKYSNTIKKFIKQ